MSVFFIFVSVISFCLKTHPGFRVDFTPTNIQPTASATNLPNIPQHQNIMPPTLNASSYREFKGNNSSASSSSNSNRNSNSNDGLASGVSLLQTTFKVINYTSPLGGNYSSSLATPIATFSLEKTRRNERTRRESEDADTDTSHAHGWHQSFGQPHEAFFYVELVCNVWFFFEVIIRFIVSPLNFKIILTCRS